MTISNPIDKTIYKENRKVSFNDPSKLLAESFNGLVLHVDEEYIHES